MPTQEPGLEIPVSFTLEEARAALKELEAAARDAGKRIGNGLDPKVPAQATNHLAKLKGQMGQAREAAFFFTSALQEFGPAGQMAQRAIGGIVGGIMGGGGLLIALELGRVAIGLIADAFQAERERIAEIDKGIAGTVASAKERVAQLRTELVRVQSGASGVAVAQFRSDIQKLNKEILVELQKSEEIWGKGSLNRTERFVQLVAQRKELTQSLRDEQRGIAAVETARSEAEKKAKSEAEAAALAEQRRQWDSLALAEDIIAKRIQGERDLTKAVEDEDKKRRMEAVHPFAGDAVATVGLTSDEQASMDAWMEAIRRQQEEVDRLRDAYRAARDAAVGMAKDAARGFTNDVARSLTGVTRGSKAYAEAMREAGGNSVQAADLSAAAFLALAQNHLASLAERSTAEALWETAQGLAALAQAALGDPRAAAAAALHFKSAAMYGVIGAVAGAGAFTIGQTRGMTAEERASVASAQAQNQAGGGAGGGGGYTAGSARDVGGPAQGAVATTSREIIMVIGDPFETPAETARRVARRLRLANDLNLISAEG